MDHTSHYANGTFLTTRLPWSVYVKARVMCPDGKVRVTHRISEPDSAFSIPASIKAKGKTVAGFITVVDNPEDTLMFHPQGKNAVVFDKVPR